MPAAPLSVEQIEHLASYARGLLLYRHLLRNVLSVLLEHQPDPVGVFLAAMFDSHLGEVETALFAIWGRTLASFPRCYIKLTCVVVLRPYYEGEMVSFSAQCLMPWS